MLLLRGSPSPRSLSQIICMFSLVCYKGRGSDGGVSVQTVRSLLGWAADSMRLLDEGGASPLDLAMQADAARVISILRSLH